MNYEAKCINRIELKGKIDRCRIKAYCNPAGCRFFQEEPELIHRIDDDTKEQLFQGVEPHGTGIN